MIERDVTEKVKSLARQFPAMTITGPRQSGKSTLSKAIFSDHPYASLENRDIRSAAMDDPRRFLAQYPKGAILDEIQRCPDIPSYLQEMIDNDPVPGRWIMTGSQNLALLSTVSQSLAGRTAVLHLLPLTRGEVQRFKEYPRDLDTSLLTGGYPAILDKNYNPVDWQGAYVNTYIERDVRNITNVSDLTTFQLFFRLCAGRTAQLLNLSSLGSDAGISQPTAKAWMSILEASFIAFRLPSFVGNLRKRLVKMPKLYFYDPGLCSWLIGIREVQQLATHPLRGAIFETWVVSEIMKHRANRGEHHGMYFYRDQHGVEADVVIESANKLTIVEAKAGMTATSEMFDSIRRVKAILESSYTVEAIIVYGGEDPQIRHDIKLVPWNQMHTIAW